MKKKDIEHQNIDFHKPDTTSPLQMNDLFGVFENLDKQTVTDYVIKQVINHKVSMLTF